MFTKCDFSKKEQAHVMQDLSHCVKWPKSILHFLSLGTRIIEAHLKVNLYSRGYGWLSQNLFARRFGLQEIQQFLKTSIPIQQ